MRPRSRLECRRGRRRWRRRGCQWWSRPRTSRRTQNVRLVRARARRRLLHQSCPAELNDSCQTFAMRLVPAVVLVAACATPVPPLPPVPPPQPPPAARQNPSPMVDATRAHQRVERREPAGRRVTINDVLEKPVEVLITPAVADRADLVIHFHGVAWLPMQAAEATGLPLIIASVNLGAGSRRYSMPFEDPAVFV